MSWRVGANEKDPYTHRGFATKGACGSNTRVCEPGACGSNIRDLSQEDRRLRHSADRSIEN